MLLLSWGQNQAWHLNLKDDVGHPPPQYRTLRDTLWIRVARAADFQEALT